MKFQPKFSHLKIFHLFIITSGVELCVNFTFFHLSFAQWNVVQLLLSMLDRSPEPSELSLFTANLSVSLHLIYFLCLLHLSEISVASTLRNLLKCFYSTLQRQLLYIVHSIVYNTPAICHLHIYYRCQSVYCTYFPSRCESVPSFVHILPNESG